tara:strand:+ start:6682 stop:7008 length:327 start_codon:yes stop_codon:yes gene_type:complete
LNRKSVSLTASENIRVPLTRGNAVLVQLKGTGFTGTVDFQSSVDGANWANHPYVQQHTASPSKSVAQISNPSTATTYLITAPVANVRINTSVSAGSVAIVYREVLIEN